ncbi:MAG: hypothetical protein HKM24_06985 [Gammaproteobacteria bacterium]|nr:hypothetical protein [Gammaproteobacteria bacterium]
MTDSTFVGEVDGYVEDDGLRSELCANDHSGLMAMTYWIGPLVMSLEGVRQVIFRLDARLSSEESITAPDYIGQRLIATAWRQVECGYADTAINSLLRIADEIFEMESDDAIKKAVRSTSIWELRKQAWEAIFSGFIEGDYVDDLVGMDIASGDLMSRSAEYLKRSRLINSALADRMQHTIRDRTGEASSATCVAHADQVH